MSGDICAPGIEWVGAGILLSTPQGLAQLPNRELCSLNVSCAEEERLVYRGWLLLASTFPPTK